MFLYSTITTDGKTTLKTHDNVSFGDEIRTTVGGYFDAIVMDDLKCVMYVHDEGHLIDLPINPIATALSGRIVAGDVIIVGTHGPNGYDGENYDITPEAYGRILILQEVTKMRHLHAKPSN